MNLFYSSWSELSLEFVCCVVSGAEIFSPYVGDSEKAIVQLFRNISGFSNESLVYVVKAMI